MTLISLAVLFAVITGQAVIAYREHTRNWQALLFFVVALPIIIALDFSFSTGIEKRTLEFVEKVLAASAVG